MKSYQRILALILSVILAICCLSGTVVADFSTYTQNTYENDSSYFDNHPLGTVEGETVSISVVIDNNDTPFSPQGLHIPNKMIAAVTPLSDGFDILLTNIGVDSVSYVYLSLNITKHDGTTTGSHPFYAYDVPVGATHYHFKLAKFATVQETVKISGYAMDGVQYVFSEATTYRYNFAGGGYGTLDAYDGERHHIPSKKSSNLTEYSGPAIRMLPEDHKLTASHGSGKDAREFRNKEAEYMSLGKFDKAMQLGIDDLRDNFGSKYDKAISEMISYAESKGYITSGSVK